MMTFAPHIVLPEPLLRFDPVDAQQLHPNPQEGLRRFGPFSSRTIQPHTNVRVALLATQNDRSRVAQILNGIWGPSMPAERRSYLPPYPGFKSAFGCRMAQAADAAQLRIDPKVDSQISDAMHPHALVAGAIGDCLRQLSLVRSEFDVVAIYLPPRWAAAYKRTQDFNLHDSIKAIAAQLGIPTQILTDDALNYHCRASVGWRLGQALYAKAGGTPYKLATKSNLLDPNAAFIGLAYATRVREDGTTSFTVCASQIFDSSGGGMDFVAFDVSDNSNQRNPILSREQMRGVISATLSVYADRTAGHRPSRLVIHKLFPFTDGEIAGSADAWGSSDGLECLSLTQTSWLGVEKQSTDLPGSGYAPKRGTVVALDGFTRLLWIAGNAPSATLTGHANFFQGGKGIPRPQLMTRWSGSGDLTQAAFEVLALSKVDWNNDALYGALPVTVKYAQVLAQVVKHVPTLPSTPFDYRLFM